MTGLLHALIQFAEMSAAQAAKLVCDVNHCSSPFCQLNAEA